MTVSEHDLGTQDIRKLLFRQAVPASVGILFMTVNILIDTIFVGQWIGPLAIAALTVVTPIAFLIASIGLAIGVGGSSVISRAMGSENEALAGTAFGHQVLMTSAITLVLVFAGWFYSEELLILFGAKGEIMAPAKAFLYPILFSAPLQAFCAMGNSVMRAENKAKFAMMATITASIGNILLDVLFIRVLGWGVFGAAMATAISFLICFLFLFWFFIFKSRLRLWWKHFGISRKMLSEISALSFTTFARQGVISILSVLLNHILYAHGADHAITVYGIISKMLMFALFPVNGITEGFLPIAGFNYGAEKKERVRKSITISIQYAGAVAIGIYAIILIFAEPIVTLFSNDGTVIKDAPNALRWVFAASPVIAVQLIGAAYFQAAGKSAKALSLTLSKQGFFLIPLLLILPDFFGIFGVWVAFPIADILATIVTGLFLKTEMHKNLH